MSDSHKNPVGRPPEGEPRRIRIDNETWESLDKNRSAFIRDAIAYALEYRDDFTAWRKSREKAE